MALPGYEYLQEYYMVKRNGDEIGVHIDHVTDAEIDEKATRLRAMSTACVKHADELVRYKKLRITHVAAE